VLSGTGAREWWRDAVVYQVYIRSFADSDGDGVGDIAGIRSHLAHIAELGVDALWITPWYRSPMADGGYDVADYRAIDPLFGSLDDARGLVVDAHALGLRLFVDLVPNHTSSEHRWFHEAMASGRNSPARARYHFRDGRGPGGAEPPNNWGSVFGGAAWDPAPDDGLAPRQWYLHLFDTSQPDLNWANPEVRAEFESILEFWLGVGVDGFRIDVAMYLDKDPGLADLPAGTAGDAAAAPAEHPYDDREGVHDIYRRWRAVLDQHGPDHVFCGEIDLGAARLARYLRPDELHTSFNFDFIRACWAPDPLRRSIDRTLETHAAVGAPPTWVLGNHDLPRPVYRLGRRSECQTWDPWVRRETVDQAAGLRRARAGALLYLALPGSAYIYQGDELGLPEVLDLPPEARQDPTFARTGGEDIGRDGCRVPIPWNGTESPFGFGPMGSTPWLPQPASWAELSVAAQATDPGSTLSLYRDALRLRRSSRDLASDAFAWLPAPEEILAFRRGERLACVVNFSSEPLPVPPGAAVLLSSAPVLDGMLPPDAAAWYETPSDPGAIEAGSNAGGHGH
jgi:alpha-glucosidase